MTKLLMGIERRTRYLDRAFPKSPARQMDEEIEQLLSRYPDGGKAVTAEIIAEMMAEYPEVSIEVAPED
jgi:hypothetical protein